MPVRVAIRILGRVQGVFFRQAAQRRARELDIVGFAENTSEGALYIEAQGATEDIRVFTEWCRRGSPLARVSDLSVESLDRLDGEADFEIR